MDLGNAEMAFVPKLDKVAPLGAIVELDCPGVTLLARQAHVVVANVAIAFVPKQVCVALLMAIVAPELHIVLFVNLRKLTIRMIMKNNKSQVEEGSFRSAFHSNQQITPVAAIGHKRSTSEKMNHSTT